MHTPECTDVTTTEWDSMLDWQCYQGLAGDADTNHQPSVTCSPFRLGLANPQPASTGGIMPIILTRQQSASPGYISARVDL
ncbi:unnamed protein product [Protopolystoma xenopodis]|uniref:Uncharacterized protein n=1 Tax=Protopolystoma xenopodis TaxID=117903 RepID=A0A3S5AD06_9PLAT|nr:unnamed protein product [Protopolystoma xenopodis]